MNSAASLLDPASNPTTYVVAVLNLYGELPDTPPRTNPQDQRQARSWFDCGVSLTVVEAASATGFLAPGSPSWYSAITAYPLVGLLPTGHRRTSRKPRP